MGNRTFLNLDALLDELRRMKQCTSQFNCCTTKLPFEQPCAKMAGRYNPKNTPMASVPDILMCKRRVWPVAVLTPWVC
jgi:hypothetical protein